MKPKSAKKYLQVVKKYSNIILGKIRQKYPFTYNNVLPFSSSSSNWETALCLQGQDSRAEGVIQAVHSHSQDPAPQEEGRRDRGQVQHQEEGEGQDRD